MKGKIPWVEKYRPKNLDEIVGHQTQIEIIKRFLDKQDLPHLLFYGPAGTGKTSLIKAIASTIWKDDPILMTSSIMELNASNERGIDVVRHEIHSFATTQGYNTGFKLIVLDEVDYMTSDAQSALRKIIETYTANIRFCLISNYLTKIIPAIQSRCLIFRFNPLPNDQIYGGLKKIADNENIKITPSGINALIGVTNGDMRRAINILQMVASGNNHIDGHIFYELTNKPNPIEIEKLFNQIISLNDDQISEALKLLTDYLNNHASDIIDVFNQFYESKLKQIEQQAESIESESKSKSESESKLYNFIEKMSELEDRLGNNQQIHLTRMIQLLKE